MFALLPRGCAAALRALAIGTLALLAAAPAHAGTEPMRYTTAEFVAANDTSPPHDTADWRSVSLFHRRTQASPDAQYAGWYRIAFEVPADSWGEWGVHVRELMPSAELWLNDRIVGYAYAPPVPETTLRTYFFSLRADWIRPGRNVLYFRTPPPGDSRTVLSSVLIGPAADVLIEHDSRHFWEATLRHVVVAGAAVVGGMLILFWSLRRQEVIYGLFGLVALGWAYLTIGYFTSIAPLPQPWFGLFTSLIDYWSETAMLLFVMHFTGTNSRHRDLVALGYAVVSTAITLVDALISSDWWWNWYSQPWEYSVFVLTAISLFLMARHAWRARSFENLVLAGAVAALAVAYTVDQVANDSGNLEWLAWTPAAYGVVLIVFGIVLTRRFATALSTVEALNAGLEQRISAREKELAANFRALAEAQRRESVLHERNRIMRDMHDGIGAQLMISMQSLERGQTDATHAAAVLRDCVEELRITIDSLDIQDNDLGALLGTVRYRLANKLSLAGIEMDWEVGDIPPLSALDDEGALHAMRFVQEALNNVLKHSGANRIRVSAQWDAGRRRAVVEIADNGHGFDLAGTQGRRGHRGLDNLRHRAERLGARLSIDSDASGTRVRLEIPQHAWAGAPELTRS